MVKKTTSIIICVTKLTQHTRSIREKMGHCIFGHFPCQIVRLRNYRCRREILFLYWGRHLFGESIAFPQVTDWCLAFSWAFFWKCRLIENTCLKQKASLNDQRTNSWMCDLLLHCWFLQQWRHLCLQVNLKLIV